MMLSAVQAFCVVNSSGACKSTGQTKSYSNDPDHRLMILFFAALFTRIMHTIFNLEEVDNYPSKEANLQPPWRWGSWA